ncbi:DEAD/DEAH box helicase [Nonomuraea sp. NN258]|nr:DEAD/DEAH box helicase [Nonomuraea antri]
MSQFRRLHGSQSDHHDREAIARVQSLIQPFMLRRTKSDPAISANFTNKIEITHVVTLSDEQRGMYENHVQDAFAQVEQSTGTSSRGTSVLALITGCRQIANSPAHFYEASPSSFSDPRINAAHSPKLVRLENIMSDIRDRGQAALVFTSLQGDG